MLSIKGNPMNNRIRVGFKLLALLLLTTVATGCVNNNVKRVNTVKATHAERELPTEKLLDVTITTFNPGYVEPLPDDSRIYPEVRKAEAGFMPFQLRQAMQNTGQWGAVRVTPEKPIAPELLVEGEIIHSDGETLELRIIATDATGKEWLNRRYEEVAARLSYTDADPAKLDPFQDLYNRVANDLLHIRNKTSGKQLRDIRQVAFLRFADNLAPDAFGDYLGENRGRYVVKGLPAKNDPNIARIERIRERDYRLIDSLDQYYAVYESEMQQPYDEWRAASYREARNERKLKQQAAGRMIAGAAAVAAGIYGMGNASNGSEAAASQVAIFGGGYLFKSGLDKRTEAKIHREALKELGESLSSEVKPRRVTLEGRTVTLSGSAEAQYEDWRKMLKDVYAEETGFTPGTKY